MLNSRFFFVLFLTVFRPNPVLQPQRSNSNLFSSRDSRFQVDWCKPLRWLKSRLAAVCPTLKLTIATFRVWRNSQQAVETALSLRSGARMLSVFSNFSSGGAMGMVRLTNRSTMIRTQCRCSEILTKAVDRVIGLFHKELMTAEVAWGDALHAVSDPLSSPVFLSFCHYWVKTISCANPESVRVRVCVCVCLGPPPQNCGFGHTVHVLSKACACLCAFQLPHPLMTLAIDWLLPLRPGGCWEKIWTKQHVGSTGQFVSTEDFCKGQIHDYSVSCSSLQTLGMHFAEYRCQIWLICFGAEC